MKTTVDIIINAPIHETYGVFADIANADENVEAIEKIEMINNPDELIGARWRETRTEFGKTTTVEMWVTRAETNEYYEVEADDHGVHYLSRYDFEELGEDKTKVTLTFEGQPKNLGAKIITMSYKLFENATKKLFLKDMEDLKQLLES